jgi:hypothetical protein
MLASCTENLMFVHWLLNMDHLLNVDLRTMLVFVLLQWMRKEVPDEYEINA